MLACSKVAVALLLVSIKPFNTVLLACKMLLGLIGAWTITFTIALAIQYARSPFWSLSSSRYMDQEALYTGLAVTHILLDIGLVVLPMILMWKVQMSQWKCFQICALFGLRFLSVTLASLPDADCAELIPRSRLVFLSLLYCTSSRSAPSSTRSPWTNRGIFSCRHYGSNCYKVHLLSAHVSRASSEFSLSYKRG